jgi:hypothetical protein
MHHIVLSCAHDQKAHALQCVELIVKTRWPLPVLVGLAKINDLKHNEASFSTISTDLLCLRVTQKPRSPDLLIFVLTNGQTDG